MAFNKGNMSHHGSAMLVHRSPARVQPQVDKQTTLLAFSKSIVPILCKFALDCPLRANELDKDFKFTTDCLSLTMFFAKVAELHTPTCKYDVTLLSHLCDVFEFAPGVEVSDSMPTVLTGVTRELNDPIWSVITGKLDADLSRRVENLYCGRGIADSIHGDICVTTSDAGEIFLLHITSGQSLQVYRTPKLSARPTPFILCTYSGSSYESALVDIGCNVPCSKYLSSGVDLFSLNSLFLWPTFQYVFTEMICGTLSWESPPGQNSTRQHMGYGAYVTSAFERCRLNLCLLNKRCAAASALNGTNITVRRIDLDCSNFRDAARELVHDMSCLVQVERVENALQYMRYANEERVLQFKRGNKPLERYLLHGTRDADPYQVACSEVGIDFRHAVSKSLYWGRGSYFTDDLSYAMQYGHVPHGLGIKFLLLCKVMLGKMVDCVNTNFDLIKPPISGDGEDNDSVRGRLPSGRYAHVVYDLHRVKVEYILTVIDRN